MFKHIIFLLSNTQVNNTTGWLIIFLIRPSNLQQQKDLVDTRALFSCDE